MPNGPPRTTKSPRTPPLTAVRSEALNDAPMMTANAPTLAAIVNERALFDVRRGLRAAFSWANCPVTPKRRGSGAETTLPRTFANHGPANAAPASTIAAPMPAVLSDGSLAPRTSKKIPSAMKTKPAADLFADERASISASRNARNGAKRVARNAGTMAAINVVATPRTKPTDNVCTRRTVGPGGIMIPRPDSPARSPMAIATPAPIPSPDATMPTATASPRTTPPTWRGRAPRVRRRASSRVR